MSKMDTEKRKPKIRKLFLNCETLRILSDEALREVAGGNENPSPSGMVVC